MQLNKDYFVKYILPILITSLLSALISILTNFLSAYTGTHVLHTDPVAVGGTGFALKTIHSTFS